MLLETLQDLLQEVTEKVRQSEARVAKHRLAVTRAQEDVARAKDQETAAIQADEHTQTACQELRAYVNGLLDKPRIVLDKLNALSAHQVDTAQTRVKAGAIVRHQEQVLREEARSFQGAEYDLSVRHKDYQEAAYHFERAAQHRPSASGGGGVRGEGCSDAHRGRLGAPGGVDRLL